MKEQAIFREDYDRRKATLHARRFDLEFTRVTAPVSGIVSDRRVDAGNVIAGGLSTSDVLTTIVSTDQVYFNFEASEAQLLKYQREAEKSGGKVEIRLQDEDAYRWNDAVDFSDNAICRTVRTGETFSMMTVSGMGDATDGRSGSGCSA